MPRHFGFTFSEVSLYIRIFFSNSDKGQQNFNATSANENKPIDCTDFEEETVRLYLNFVHNIKQSHEEIKFSQLLELVRFLAEMGKTGNYS